MSQYYHTNTPSLSGEVVGIMIDGTIYSGLEGIVVARASKKYDRFIFRQESEFMAACDLGINWDNLSKCPALFIIDKNGDIRVTEECLIYNYLSEDGRKWLLIQGE